MNNGIVYRLALFLILGLMSLTHLIVGVKLIKPVAWPFGILWIFASVLFILTGISKAVNKRYWWIIGLVAVIVSQIIIIYFWKDAMVVTIGNLVILLAVIIGIGSWGLKYNYQKDVMEGIQRTRTNENDLVTEKDIDHLPELVIKYLNYTGIVNRPKVKKVRMVFEATMRNKDQDWFRLTTEQYDFFERYERLFFIDAVVKGLPTTGYHRYKNGEASMVIKLLSLFPVVDVKGDKLFKAETVTLFNDMCIFAPATLIDKRIKWEPFGNQAVKASFSNQATTVSAVLYFDETGKLVNFVSDDRYDISTMKQFRFSTPILDYSDINGYKLCRNAEAIWHYPEGKFTYGRYTLKDIEYNVVEY